MALRGHVFDKQLFSSDCYALVTDTFLNKNSGIIKGCDLTNTASSIYIDNGYFVVKGRPIQEEGGTTIEVGPGSLDGIYCKLVCEIDMSQTNTTTSLNQVSYKILEDTTDYPTLMQEDITDGGTIYQFELAKFRRTLNGIEDFVDTRSFLNFDSIYDFVKNEIKRIEEGSLFITEEEFGAEMLNSGVVVSATEPTGNDRKKVWMQKGKNLYDINDVVNGYSIVVSTGALTPFEGRTSSGFIAIEPNTTYVFSSDGVALEVNYAIYDKNKVYINGAQASLVSTPSNAKYIRFYHTNTRMQTAQLEQGPTITEYEEYIEPKIYVKNDNDVYEKFISKEEQIAERFPLLTALDGYSVLNQFIYKQGKNHYFGWAIIQKTSGNFTNTQETVATLSKTPTFQYNFFGAGATDEWGIPNGFAYAFINNSKQLLIRAQNCNYVKLHIDIVTTD